MTTQTLTLPAISGARPANDRVPFHRLVAIELRRTVNSRGGFWFAVGIFVATLLLLAGHVLGGSEADQTVALYFASGVQLFGIFVPIVALLLVTSEWSQRTAMTTLAQQPRRHELLLSKLLASLIIGFAALAGLLLLVLGLGAFAANDTPGATTLDAQVVGQSCLMVLLSIVSGFGFGAAFLKSAPAIAGYVLFPTIVFVIGSFGAIESVVKWINQATTAEAIIEYPMSTAEWKYFLVSSFTWSVVPLAVGWWRVMRSEVG